MSAACPDELQPSLVLTIAVRRSPNLVVSDESSRDLIRQFVGAVIDAPTEGPETRLGLVVAGPQRHAEQLAKLAHLASVQMDAPGFFDLVLTPGKFDAAVQGRLDQLQMLVERALHELGVVEAGTALVESRTWQLLSRLTVLMPRLESPDETDWSRVVNSLARVARDSDPSAALGLRDRLVDRANEYSPSAARVDLTMLRRDSHALLDPTTRRHDGTGMAGRHSTASTDGRVSPCVPRLPRAMVAGVCAWIEAPQRWNYSRRYRVLMRWS